MPDARELGELGEEIAARTLLRSGFVIEGRRVRTTHAEIDLVAREGAVMVVVEVKTMRFEHVPAPRGVSADLARARFRESGRLGNVQLQRLERAADWLGKRRGLCARVDVVEVWLCARPRSLVVEHRRDARKSFRVRTDPVGGSAELPR